jgi:hypothetical protein
MGIANIISLFPSEKELMDIIMDTSKTVWDRDLVEKDIEAWLSNFTGEVYSVDQEKRLALWLLTHFTFYNHAEVAHLCKVVYNDLIHRIVLNTDTTKIPLENAVDDFFSVANIISPESTSGSGGFIAYFFRHENELPMNIFNFSLKNIGSGVQHIIVIDDVTLTEGTAGQMYKFWEDATSTFKGTNFYLLTLVASQTSINFLTSKFGIEAIAAIKLDNRDKCFSDESDTFSSFREMSNHKEIIETGKAFASHYGTKISIPHIDPLGYADGQYSFGFFYNIPDNTLPIFWAQLNGWLPILRRYHKNYKTQKYLHDERFV